MVARPLELKAKHGLPGQWHRVRTQCGWGFRRGNVVVECVATGLWQAYSFRPPGNPWLEKGQFEEGKTAAQAVGRLRRSLERQITALSKLYMDTV